MWLHMYCMLDSGGSAVETAAVTLRSPVTVTVQVGSPEESVPVLSQFVHELKTQPEPGLMTAVSVTCCPSANDALAPVAHGVVQLIPAGLLVIVGMPLPAVDPVSAAWLALNVACTFLAAFIVTVHIGMPEESVDVLSQLLQPPNTAPAPATAVNVTCCPAANEAVFPLVQGELQLIPDGLLTIVPTPGPTAETLSGSTVGTKVAVRFITGTVAETCP